MHSKKECKMLHLIMMFFILNALTDIFPIINANQVTNFACLAKADCGEGVEFTAIGCLVAT